MFCNVRKSLQKIRKFFANFRKGGGGVAQQQVARIFREKKFLKKNYKSQKKFKYPEVVSNSRQKYSMFLKNSMFLKMAKSREVDAKRRIIRSGKFLSPGRWMRNGVSYENLSVFFTL